MRRHLELVHPAEKDISGRDHPQFQVCWYLEPVTVQGVYARQPKESNAWGSPWYEVQFICSCTCDARKLDNFSYIELMRYLDGK